MDMRANLLTSLCGAKHSDDRNFGFLADLRGSDIVSKDRIERCWGRLVVIYAVQPNAEKVHGEKKISIWREHWIFDRRVHC